jgi:hypothetical protein
MANHIGPRDADHLLRDGSADLDGDETIAFTLAGGNRRVAPLSVYVLVPEASAGDGLLVTVQSLTDGKEIEVTHTEPITDSATLPFLLELPIPFSDDTSWQVVLDCTNEGDDFGATEVWVGLSTEFAQVPADE